MIEAKKNERTNTLKEVKRPYKEPVFTTRMFKIHLLKSGVRIDLPLLQ